MELHSSGAHLWPGEERLRLTNVKNSRCRQKLLPLETQQIIQLRPDRFIDPELIVHHRHHDVVPASMQNGVEILRQWHHDHACHRNALVVSYSYPVRRLPLALILQQQEVGEHYVATHSWTRLHSRLVIQHEQAIGDESTGLTGIQRWITIKLMEIRFLAIVEAVADVVSVKFVVSILVESKMVSEEEIVCDISSVPLASCRAPNLP